MEARSEIRYEGKKRDRHELAVVDSPRSDSDSMNPKRARVDSDLNSSVVKRIQDDLLNILDDSETVADRDPAIQGLDSVIRSFEEEILVSDDLQVRSDLVVSHAELGFLLEASDDELGLPPSFRSSGGSTTADPPAISDSLPQLPNYDSFEYGQFDLSNSPDVINTEFVSLGCLFDNAFAVGISDDMSEFLFQSESLPAV